VCVLLPASPASAILNLPNGRRILTILVYFLIDRNIYDGRHRIELGYARGEEERTAGSGRRFHSSVVPGSSSVAAGKLIAE